jgi:hypothetical protein
MLDSKRCKERQPFTVMGSGRSTPSTAVWSILGDVRCEEDARRFRGEDDSETQKRELSGKADWYQERGQATKNLSNLWQSKLVGAACGACGAMWFAWAEHPASTQHYPGITASQGQRERNKEPHIHHF